MKKTFVYPGHFAVAGAGEAVSTLLGSCVSVVMADEIAKISGLNHFLLPNTPSGDAPTPRYGDAAIKMLHEEMLRRGANPRRIKAKIYGGGKVLDLNTEAAGIGSRNVEFAEKALSDLGIPIEERDVGLEYSRRIKVEGGAFQVEVERLAGGKQVADGKKKLSALSQLVVAEKVRVVIVDDSATVRSMFRNVFKRHGIEVVGVASNAYEARDIIVKLKPDVVTLDIEMPRMNGVTFLEKLMKYLPTPVVMVSSLSQDGEAAMASLELGAVEFFQKPSQSDAQSLRIFGEALVEKVRAAASVRPKAKASSSLKSASSTARFSKLKTFRVLCVGGNTGSKDSLITFLSHLAEDTPPVLVANSLLSPILDTFVPRIQTRVPQLKLSIAKDGQYIGPGEVCFAPSFHHMNVQSAAGDEVCVKLVKGAPIANKIPSTDALLESACQAFSSEVLGVLLSGFGSDGVRGAEMVKRKGGQIVCEDPESSVSPFLPEQVIEKGLADDVHDASRLAKLVLQYRGKKAA